MILVIKMNFHISHYMFYIGQAYIPKLYIDLRTNNEAIKDHKIESYMEIYSSNGGDGSLMQGWSRVDSMYGVLSTFADSKTTNVDDVVTFYTLDMTKQTQEQATHSNIKRKMVGDQDEETTRSMANDNIKKRSILKKGNKKSKGNKGLIHTFRD
ncbi:hypothetical protein ACJX0J_013273, partial [Zea mays]